MDAVNEGGHCGARNVHSLIEYLVLSASLFGVVAAMQAVAARLAIPEATALSILGIGIGASYFVVVSFAPHVAQFFLSPLINPVLPVDAYLWLFLPPLMMQAALAIDVRSFLLDAAPILLLAIVAVIVTTVCVGVAMSALAPYGLVACLLLGAIVGENDASAVITIFREVGAPARIIRLVEGESLLDDATALALSGVLLAMLAGDAADATLGAGLKVFAYSFVGGAVVGLVVGRVAASVLPLLGDIASAEAAFTMALPYPLYLFANDTLHVSGVIAIVCAGLVINSLGRTRLSPSNWRHLQMVWEQIAALAGAIIFLLAAIQIPRLLSGESWHHVWLLAVALIAALAARLFVLFVMLPALTWMRLSKPIPAGFRLVITWGGLRGALTLVLAMGVAQNSAIPNDARTFISVTAAGFALFTLLVNGTTLRWLISRLGLNRLTRQEEAMQNQALVLSSRAVDAALARMNTALRADAKTLTDVASEYRRGLSMSAVVADPESSVSERDGLAIGLVTLAAHERDLVPEYGDGVISVANLDAMMRNTGQMIEAARSKGRVGYHRVALEILEIPLRYRIAKLLYRFTRFERPLAAAMVERFELLLCRRVVLERLRDFNATRLKPLVGELTTVLDSVIALRIGSAELEIAELRNQFGSAANALERRLLLLRALKEGRRSLEAMAAERVISKTVFDRVRNAIDRAWSVAIRRPRVRLLVPAPIPVPAQHLEQMTSLPTTAERKSA